MSRPRGYAAWNPQSGTRLLLDAISGVLDEYRNNLPLTLRQVFYRLVGTDQLSKTERDYSRLCETMNRARRGGFIDWNAIRDDGHTTKVTSCYSGFDDLAGTLRYHAANARIDRQQGQEQRLVVWCEAAGMVPQLHRITNPYGIPVDSSGGFDSVTCKRKAAVEFANQGDTEVLHIGDHDPSGVHVFSSLGEDIAAFAKAHLGHVTFTRLAVTPEQIEHYNLPTAPPKKTDNRAFNGRATAQVEALDPRDLANILESAINERIDHDTYDEALDAEKDMRQQAVELFPYE